MSQQCDTPRRVVNLNAAVAPYKYNPSSWRQRIPICLLAVVAAVLAGHLAMFQWRIVPYAWDPVFGNQTEKVLTSDIARRMDHWIGIPDAALGAIAYLGDALFGLAGSTRRWQFRPWLVVLFGIDVIPLGLVSAVLVLCQAFILGEYCFLCLITAAISLLLVYLAFDEVRVSCVYLWRVWRQTCRLNILWQTFWGWPSLEAHRIAEEMAR